MAGVGRRGPGLGLELARATALLLLLVHRAMRLLLQPGRSENDFAVH